MPRQSKLLAAPVGVSVVPADLAVSSDPGVVLAPWQERYAEWLVIQPELPSQSERAKRVGAYLGRVVKYTELAALETMPAFRTRLTTIQGEVAREAKAVLTTGATEAMRAHMLAIEKLTKDEDWKTLAKYTVPLLDRVWQKQSEGEVNRAQIVVHLHGNTFADRHLPKSGEIVVEASEVVIVEEQS